MKYLGNYKIQEHEESEMSIPEDVINYSGSEYTDQVSPSNHLLQKYIDLIERDDVKT